MSNDRHDDKTVREHDVVVLLRDLPDAHLIAGDTGTVVYIYDKHSAFEVEFANPLGKPRFLVLTVEANDVLKLQGHGLPRQRVA